MPGSSADDLALDRILDTGANDPVLRSAVGRLQRDDRDWDRSSQSRPRGSHGSDGLKRVPPKHGQRQQGSGSERAFTSMRPGELTRPPSSSRGGAPGSPVPLSSAGSVVMSNLGSPRASPRNASVASMSPRGSPTGLDRMRAAANAVAGSPASPRSARVDPGKRFQDVVKAASKEEKKRYISSVTTLVDKIDEEQQRQAEKERLLADLRRQNKKLEADVAEREAMYQKAREEAMRRKEKQRGLEAQQLKQAEELAALKSEAESAKKKYQRAKEEISKNRARIEQQEEQQLLGKDEAQREMARMRQEMRELQGERDSLMRKLQELIDAKANLETSNHHLKETKAELSRDASDLKARVRRLEDSNDELRSSAEQAEIEYRRQVSSLERTTERLEANREKLEEQLHREADESRRKVDKLERSCVRAEDANRDLEKENKDLGKEVASLKQQLEDLKGDTDPKLAALAEDNKRLRVEIDGMEHEREAIDKRLKDEQERRYARERELSSEVERVRGSLTGEIDRLQEQLREAERTKRETEARLKDEQFSRGVHESEAEREIERLRGDLSTAKSTHTTERDVLSSQLNDIEAKLQSVMNRKTKARERQLRRVMQLRRALEERERSAMLWEDRLREALDELVEKSLRPAAKRQLLAACQDELMQNKETLQRITGEARGLALSELLERYLKDPPGELEKEAHALAMAALRDAALNDPAVMEEMRREVVRDNLDELKAAAQQQLLTDLKAEAMASSTRREELMRLLAQEILETNEGDLRSAAWKKAQLAVAEEEGDAMCEKARNALFNATLEELRRSDERRDVYNDARAKLLAEEKAAIAADTALMRVLRDEARGEVAGGVRESLTDEEMEAVREEVLRNLERDIMRADGQELLQAARERVSAECEAKLRSDADAMRAVREDVAARMRDDLVRSDAKAIAAEARERVRDAVERDVRQDRDVMDGFRGTANEKLLNEVLNALHSDPDAMARLRQDAVASEATRLLDTEGDDIRSAARRAAEAEVLQREGHVLCDEARASVKQAQVDELAADPLLMEKIRAEARDALVAVEAGDLKGSAEVRQHAIARAAEDMPRSAIDAAATEVALRHLTQEQRAAARDRAVEVLAEDLKGDRSVVQQARDLVVSKAAADILLDKDKMRDLRSRAADEAFERIREDEAEALRRAAQERVAQESGPALCQEARAQLFDEVRENLREDRSAMSVIKADARRSLADQLTSTDLEVQRAARADAIAAVKAQLMDTEPDALRAAAAELVRGDPEVRELAVEALKEDKVFHERAASAILDELRSDPARLRAVQERACDKLFAEALDDEKIVEAARAAAQHEVAQNNAEAFAAEARAELIEAMKTEMRNDPQEAQVIRQAAFDAAMAAMEGTPAVAEAAMDRLTRSLLNEEGAILRAEAQRKVEADIRAKVEKDPAEMLSLRDHAVADVVKSLEGDEGVRADAHSKAMAALFDAEGPQLTRGARQELENDLRAQLRDDPEEMQRLQRDAEMIVAEDLRSKPQTQAAAKERALQAIMDEDGEQLRTAALTQAEERVADELQRDARRMRELSQEVAAAMQRDLQADPGFRESVQRQVTQELIHGDPEIAAEARRRAEAQANQDIRRSASQMDEVRQAAVDKLVDEFCARSDVRDKAQAKAVARIAKELLDADEEALRDEARERAIEGIGTKDRTAIERDARKTVFDRSVAEIQETQAEEIMAAAQERLVDQMVAAGGADLRAAAREEVQRRMMQDTLDSEELLLRAAARREAQEAVAEREGEALCAEARVLLLESTTAELKKNSMDEIREAACEKVMEEIMCDPSLRAGIDAEARRAVVDQVVAERRDVLRAEALVEVRETIAAQDRAKLLEEATSELLAEAVAAYRRDPLVMADIAGQAQQAIREDVIQRRRDEVAGDALREMKEQVRLAQGDTMLAAARQAVQEEVDASVRSDPAAMAEAREAAVLAIQAELTGDDWDELLAEARRGAQKEAEARIAERDGGELVEEACSRIIAEIQDEVRGDEVLLAQLEQTAHANATAEQVDALFDDPSDRVAAVVVCVASHLKTDSVVRAAVSEDLAAVATGPDTVHDRTLGDQAGVAYRRVLQLCRRRAAAAPGERAATARELLPHCKATAEAVTVSGVPGRARSPLRLPPRPVTVLEKGVQCGGGREASGSPLRTTEIHLLRNAIAENRSAACVASLVPRAEEAIMEELLEDMRGDDRGRAARQREAERVLLDDAMARIRKDDALMAELQRKAVQDVATEMRGRAQRELRDDTQVVPVEARQGVSESLPASRQANASAARPTDLLGPETIAGDDSTTSRLSARENVVLSDLVAHVAQHRHVLAEATDVAMAELKRECTGEAPPTHPTLKPATSVTFSEADASQGTGDAVCVGDIFTSFSLQEQVVCMNLFRERAAQAGTSLVTLAVRAKRVIVGWVKQGLITELVAVALDRVDAGMVMPPPPPPPQGTDDSGTRKVPAGPSPVHVYLPGPLSQAGRSRLGDQPRHRHRGRRRANALVHRDAPNLTTEQQMLADSLSDMVRSDAALMQTVTQVAVGNLKARHAENDDGAVGEPAGTPCLTIEEVLGTCDPEAVEEVQRRAADAGTDVDTILKQIQEIIAADIESDLEEEILTNQVQTLEVRHVNVPVAETPVHKAALGDGNRTPPPHRLLHYNSEGTLDDDHSAPQLTAAQRVVVRDLMERMRGDERLMAELAAADTTRGDAAPGGDGPGQEGTAAVVYEYAPQAAAVGCTPEELVAVARREILRELQQRDAALDGTGAARRMRALPQGEASSPPRQTLWGRGVLRQHPQGQGGCTDADAAAPTPGAWSPLTPAQNAAVHAMAQRLAHNPTVLRRCTHTAVSELKAQHTRRSVLPSQTDAASLEEIIASMPEHTMFCAEFKAKAKRVDCPFETLCAGAQREVTACIKDAIEEDIIAREVQSLDSDRVVLDPDTVLSPRRRAMHTAVPRPPVVDVSTDGGAVRCVEDVVEPDQVVPHAYVPEGVADGTAPPLFTSMVSTASRPLTSAQRRAQQRIKAMMQDNQHVMDFVTESAVQELKDEYPEHGMRQSQQTQRARRHVDLLDMIESDASGMDVGALQETAHAEGTSPDEMIRDAHDELVRAVMAGVCRNILQSEVGGLRVETAEERRAAGLATREGVPAGGAETDMHLVESVSLVERASEVTAHPKYPTPASSCVIKRRRSDAFYMKRLTSIPVMDLLSEQPIEPRYGYTVAQRQSSITTATYEESHVDEPPVVVQNAMSRLRADDNAMQRLTAAAVANLKAQHSVTEEQSDAPRPVLSDQQVQMILHELHDDAEAAGCSADDVVEAAQRELVREIRRDIERELVAKQAAHLDAEKVNPPKAQAPTGSCRGGPQDGATKPRHQYLHVNEDGQLDDNHAASQLTTEQKEVARDVVQRLRGNSEAMRQLTAAAVAALRTQHGAEGTGDGNKTWGLDETQVAQLVHDVTGDAAAAGCSAGEIVHAAQRELVREIQRDIERELVAKQAVHLEPEKVKPPSVRALEGSTDGTHAEHEYLHVNEDGQLDDNHGARQLTTEQAGAARTIARRLRGRAFIMRNLTEAAAREIKGDHSGDDSDADASATVMPEATKHKLRQQYSEAAAVVGCDAQALVDAAVRQLISDIKHDIERELIAEQITHLEPKDIADRTYRSRSNDGADAEDAALDDAFIEAMDELVTRIQAIPSDELTEERKMAVVAECVARIEGDPTVLGGVQAGDTEAAVRAAADRAAGGDVRLDEVVAVCGGDVRRRVALRVAAERAAEADLSEEERGAVVEECVAALGAREDDAAAVRELVGGLRGLSAEERGAAVARCDAVLAEAVRRERAVETLIDAELGTPVEKRNAQTTARHVGECMAALGPGAAQGSGRELRMRAVVRWCAAEATSVGCQDAVARRALVGDTVAALEGVEVAVAASAARSSAVEQMVASAGTVGAGDDAAERREELVEACAAAMEADGAVPSQEDHRVALREALRRAVERVAGADADAGTGTEGDCLAKAVAEVQASEAHRRQAGAMALLISRVSEMPRQEARRERCEALVEEALRDAEMEGAFQDDAEREALRGAMRDLLDAAVRTPGSKLADNCVQDELVAAHMAAAVEASARARLASKVRVLVERAEAAGTDAGTDTGRAALVEAVVASAEADAAAGGCGVEQLRAAMDAVVRQIAVQHGTEGSLGAAARDELTAACLASCTAGGRDASVECSDGTGDAAAHSDKEPGEEAYVECAGPSGGRGAAVERLIAKVEALSARDLTEQKKAELVAECKAEMGCAGEVASGAGVERALQKVVAAVETTPADELGAARRAKLVAECVGAAGGPCRALTRDQREVVDAMVSKVRNDDAAMRALTDCAVAKLRAEHGAFTTSDQHTAVDNERVRELARDLESAAAAAGTTQEALVTIAEGMVVRDIKRGIEQELVAKQAAHLEPKLVAVPRASISSSADPAILPTHQYLHVNEDGQLDDNHAASQLTTEQKEVARDVVQRLRGNSEAMRQLTAAAVAALKAQHDVAGKDGTADARALSPAQVAALVKEFETDAESTGCSANDVVEAAQRELVREIQRDIERELVAKQAVHLEPEKVKPPRAYVSDDVTIGSDKHEYLHVNEGGQLDDNHAASQLTTEQKEVARDVVQRLRGNSEVMRKLTRAAVEELKAERCGELREGNGPAQCLTTQELKQLVNAFKGDAAAAGTHAHDLIEVAQGALKKEIQRDIERELLAREAAALDPDMVVPPKAPVADARSGTRERGVPVQHTRPHEYLRRAEGDGADPTATLPPDQKAVVKEATTRMRSNAMVMRGLTAAAVADIKAQHAGDPMPTDDSPALPQEDVDELVRSVRDAADAAGASAEALVAQAQQSLVNVIKRDIEQEILAAHVRDLDASTVVPPTPSRPAPGSRSRSNAMKHRYLPPNVPRASSNEDPAMSRLTSQQRAIAHSVAKRLRANAVVMKKLTAAAVMDLKAQHTVASADADGKQPAIPTHQVQDIVRGVEADAVVVGCTADDIVDAAQRQMVLEIRRDIEQELVAKQAVHLEPEKVKPPKAHASSEQATAEEATQHQYLHVNEDGQLDDDHSAAQLTTEQKEVARDVVQRLRANSEAMRKLTTAAVVALKAQHNVTSGDVSNTDQPMSSAQVAALVREIEKDAGAAGCSAADVVEAAQRELVREIQRDIERELVAKQAVHLEPEKVKPPKSDVAAGTAGTTAHGLGKKMHQYLHVNEEGRLDDNHAAAQLTADQKEVARDVVQRLRGDSEAMRQVTAAAVAALKAQHDVAGKDSGTKGTLSAAQVAALMKEFETDAESTGCSANDVVEAAQRELVREIQRDIERELVAKQAAHLDAEKVNPPKAQAPTGSCRGGPQDGATKPRHQYLHVNEDGQLDDNHAASQLTTEQKEVARDVVQRLRGNSEAMRQLTAAAVAALKAQHDVAGKDGTADARALSPAQVAALVKEFETDAESTGCSANDVVEAAQRELVREIQRDIERELVAKQAVHLEPEKVKPPRAGVSFGGPSLAYDADEPHEYLHVNEGGQLDDKHDAGQLNAVQQAVAESAVDRLRANGEAMRQLTAVAVACLKSQHGLGDYSEETAAPVVHVADVEVLKRAVEKDAVAAGCTADDVVNAAQRELVREIQRDIERELVAKQAVHLDMENVRPPKAEAPAKEVRRHPSAGGGNQQRHQYLHVDEEGRLDGNHGDVELTAGQKTIARDVVQRLRANSEAMRQLTAAAVGELKAQHGLVGADGGGGPAAGLTGRQFATLAREFQRESTAAGCTVEDIVEAARRDVVREIQRDIERELVAKQAVHLDAEKVNPPKVEYIMRKDENPTVVHKPHQYLHVNEDGQLDDNHAASQLTAEQKEVARGVARELRGDSEVMRRVTEAAVAGLRAQHGAVGGACEPAGVVAPADAEVLVAKVAGDAAAAGCSPRELVEAVGRELVREAQRNIGRQLVARQLDADDHNADTCAPVEALVLAVEGAAGGDVKTTLALDGVAWSDAWTPEQQAAMQRAIRTDVATAYGAPPDCIVVADVYPSGDGGTAADIIVRNLAGTTPATSVADAKRLTSARLSGLAMEHTASTAAAAREPPPAPSRCMTCVQAKAQYEIVVDALRVELDAAHLQLDLGYSQRPVCMSKHTQTAVTLSTSLAACLAETPGAVGVSPSGRRSMSRGGPQSIRRVTSSVASSRRRDFDAKSVRSTSVYSAVASSPARSFSLSHLPRREMPRVRSSSTATSHVRPRSVGRRTHTPSVASVAMMPEPVVGPWMTPVHSSAASPPRMRMSPEGHSATHLRRSRTSPAPVRRSATPPHTQCSSSIRRATPILGSPHSVSPFAWVHAPGNTKPLSPPRLRSSR